MIFSPVPKAHLHWRNFSFQPKALLHPVFICARCYRHGSPPRFIASPSHE